MTDRVSLQDQPLVGLTVLLPHTGTQLADNYHGIALAYAHRHVLGK
jgi:hypothetical protein